jgi:Metallo-peptidase family M12/Secretion system C-terminal sorting domain
MSTQNNSQTTLLAKATSAPHLGNIRFVQFANQSELGVDDQIRFSLSGVNNGAEMVFIIDNSIFSDPTHFSVHGSNNLGYINLYITPEGMGGSIDLVTKTYSIWPFGDSRGVLFENKLVGGEFAICAQNNADAASGVNFCEGDCGASILDVLVLRTPEANQFLASNFGIFAEWFFFVESQNINLALVNSQIPNKSVRVRSVNYQPSFAWSSTIDVDTRITEDINSVTNASNAQFLANNYKSDITVLLTNNNYTGSISAGGTGTIFGIANSLNPFSNNKFCIAQVSSIGPVRYTMAHEIAHQFGCLHSQGTNLVGCPHGRNLDNGRNTIMANGADDNTRIPNYSNPDVQFGGEMTGNIGVRDNAQQIRAAFCESTNNFPDPTFSANFLGGSGFICPNEIINLTSFVVSGDCNDPWGLFPTPNCGIEPYAYQWKYNKTPTFTNSTIVGSGQNLNFLVPPAACPTFYLRLTVTSANGLMTTRTRKFNCFSNCDGKNARKSESSLVEEKVRVFPNPASDEIDLQFSDTFHVLGIECFNTQSVQFPIVFAKRDDGSAAKISVSYLDNGLYFLRVRGEKGDQVLKICIQN